MFIFSVLSVAKMQSNLIVVIMIIIMMRKGVREREGTVREPIQCRIKQYSRNKQY